MELTATQISELLSINRKNSQLMNIYKIPLRKIFRWAHLFALLSKFLQ